MKTITTLRSAALATFAVAAVSLPTLAQATDYRNGYYNPNAECKAKENEAKLIGGILGAIAGGVIGSQVSGNGARTEGSAIGVVLGGLAGAGLGDESVVCGQKRTRNTTYSGQTYGQTRPVVYNQTVTTQRVYQPNRGYQYNNGYGNAGYTQGHNTRTQNYSHNNGYDRYNALSTRLEDVRYKLRDLRKKNRRLERRIRNDHHNYRLLQRQERVCENILRLEKKERRLKLKLRRLTRNYY